MVGQGGSRRFGRGCHVQWRRLCTAQLQRVRPGRVRPPGATQLGCLAELLLPETPRPAFRPGILNQTDTFFVPIKKLKVWKKGNRRFGMNCVVVISPLKDTEDDSIKFSVFTTPHFQYYYKEASSFIIINSTGPQTYHVEALSPCSWG